MAARSAQLGKRVNTGPLSARATSALAAGSRADAPESRRGSVSWRVRLAVLKDAKLDVTALVGWMSRHPASIAEQKGFKRIAQNAARWPDMNLADEYESETPC